MTDRIALSLSPTGANATRPVRLSPELIRAHVARAHQLRSDAIACFARQIRDWLLRKAEAPRWGACDDERRCAPPTAGLTGERYFGRDLSIALTPVSWRHCMVRSSQPPRQGCCEEI